MTTVCSPILIATQDHLIFCTKSSMIRIVTLSCLMALAVGFAPVSQHHNVVRQQTAAVVVSPMTSMPSPTRLGAVMDKSNSGATSEKIYTPKSKETPKVLGGVKIGLRKLVVVTGASSGLGLNAAVSLAKKGNYFVVMACRDVEKGKKGTDRYNLFSCWVTMDDDLYRILCLNWELSWVILCIGDGPRQRHSFSSFCFLPPFSSSVPSIYFTSNPDGK